MVESGLLAPTATLFGADQLGAGSRVAGWDGAPGARVGALEIYFADAEAHYAPRMLATIRRCLRLLPGNQSVTACSMRCPVMA